MNPGAPGGARTIALSVAGVPVSIAVDGALDPLAHEVRAVWPESLRSSPALDARSIRVIPRSRTNRTDGPAPGSGTGTGTGADATVHADPDGSDHARALYSLSGEITKIVINAHIGRAFLFHAAGAAVNGRAVGLVAESGTGKSTAVRHLVEHLGCGYLTDETRIIDPDTGAVTPYQKPVSQKAANGEKTDVPIVTEELGEPPRLTRLVLLDRRPEAAEVSVTEPSPGEAMSALVEQSSSIWRIPDAALRLARLVTSVPVVRVTYVEVAEAAPHLLPAPTAPTSPAPAGTSPSADRPAEPAPFDHLPWPADSTVLAPFADAVAFESEVVILAEESCVRIGGAAAAAFVLAYENPAAHLGELIDLAVSASGQPEDAVRAAFDTLAEHALLR